MAPSCGRVVSLAKFFFTCLSIVTVVYIALLMNAVTPRLSKSREKNTNMLDVPNSNIMPSEGDIQATQAINSTQSGVNKQDTKAIISDNFRNYTCHNNSRTAVSELLLCGNVNTEPNIVFFTSTYYSKDPVKLRNVLHVWSSLYPSILPVLFLTDDKIYTNQRELLEFACGSGWIVLLAPQCNVYSYPVLKDMFILVQNTWTDATWYGYLNGDMLFDVSLLETLDYLHGHDATLNTSFVVGTRYDMPVASEETIESANELLPLATARLAHPHHGNVAIDYFITHSNRFPWQRIPPFVIGRSAYDNWLVWYASAHRSLVSVDITESALVVHQYNNASNSDKQSHRYRGSGGNYNHQFLGRWGFSQGRISCMSYFLRYVYTNTFITSSLQHARNITASLGKPANVDTLVINTASAIFPVLKYHIEHEKEANRTGRKAQPAHASLLTMGQYSRNPMDMRKAVFKRSKAAISKCRNIHSPVDQLIDAPPTLL